MKRSVQKAALVTLGCPKNIVDSEIMAGMLNANGVQLTTNPNEADAVLINTCGFIQDAKQESVDSILKWLELKKNNPDIKVLVWGCLTERYRGEIKKAIPEVDALFGVEPFESVGRFLFGRFFAWNGREFHPRKVSTPPHTAYLKIADGCDHRCTFCAIPLFKGRYRSRTVESLVEEAGFLTGQGVKELTLVAQDTTAFGLDLNDGSNLIGLLDGLAAVDGIRWIRIMYAHPAHITDAMIEWIAGERKICRYLDIPLQHISDSVLQDMGRDTPRKNILRLILKLRSSIPGIALRSAFIVGFPGETEKAFHELKRFIEETRFERLGLFRFSREDGTSAASLPRRIPVRIAEERFRILMETQKTISSELNRGLESKRMTVLVDGRDAAQNVFFGRTESDAPEVDQTVWIREPVAVGQFVDVTIDGSSAYDLSGYPDDV